MADIDYMKIIDIISDLMSSEKKVDIKSAENNKIKSFIVEAAINKGIKLNYTLSLKSSHIEIEINSRYFKEIPIEKWIKKFEFSLEQLFYKNIGVTYTQKHEQYIISIES